MSEFTGYALERACGEESQLDDYVNGNMSNQDAHDCGILDAQGCEQSGVQAGWDRSAIGMASIDSSLAMAEAAFDGSISAAAFLGFPVGGGASAELVEGVDYDVITSNSSTVSKGWSAALDKEAMGNLKNENPTCNCCREEMQPQHGKFGKFYFCGNQCPRPKDR